MVKERKFDGLLDRRGGNGTGSDVKFAAFHGPAGRFGFNFQNDSSRGGGYNQFLPAGDASSPAKLF